MSIKSFTWELRCLCSQ